MSRKLSLILLLVLLQAPSFAQNSLRDKFDSFTKSTKSDYNSFRDAVNRQYADFLRSSWKRFSATAMTPRPEDNPVPAVEYVSGNDSRDVFRVPCTMASSVLGVYSRPGPLEPIDGTGGAEERFSFKCFGVDLEVRASEEQRNSISSMGTEDLSEAWKMLSGHQNDKLLHDLLSIRDERHFCDWAYLETIRAFSESFLGKGDPATLLSAYIFSQSGYKMRLGMTEDKLYFLFGTDNLIYDKPYFELDGSRYYSLEEDLPGDLFIADIPIRNEKSLSLCILEDQNFKLKKTRFRSFESKRYHVKAECYVDEGKIEFYRTYPSFQINDNFLTRWATYAFTPLDSGVSTQLYRWLKFALQGKTVEEATDMILDFTQSAFEYRYDDEVWGSDRVFFSEETLYYPYCDCEDKAILFTKLVREMLDLDVAIVYYPNHLAAAVRLPGTPSGDCFELPDGVYTICDPTYQGAPVGKTMPGMDNNEAKLLLIR